jgi:hypothetical protein
MAAITDTVPEALRVLRTDPDQYTDDELAELAAMASEISKLAAARFVDRLLGRGGEPA